MSALEFQDLTGMTSDLSLRLEQEGRDPKYRLASNSTKCSSDEESDSDCDGENDLEPELVYSLPAKPSKPYGLHSVNGGSGILDTADPVHHYLQYRMVSNDVPKADSQYTELVEKRRWYFTSGDNETSDGNSPFATHHQNFLTSTMHPTASALNATQRAALQGIVLPGLPPDVTALEDIGLASPTWMLGRSNLSDSAALASSGDDDLPFDFVPCDEIAREEDLGMADLVVSSVTRSGPPIKMSIRGPAQFIRDLNRDGKWSREAICKHIEDEIMDQNMEVDVRYNSTETWKRLNRSSIAQAYAMMSKTEPLLEHYISVQDPGRTHWGHVHSLTIRELFEHMAQPFIHYLFSEPVVPVDFLTVWSAADNQPLLGETIMSVSKLIKQIYLDGKTKIIDPTHAHLLMPEKDLIPSEVPIADDEAALVEHWERPEHVKVPKNFNHYKEFDLQDIPWEKTKIPIEYARERRDFAHRDFRNMGCRVPVMEYLDTMKKGRVHFVPDRMHTRYKASFDHMQLRNMMAVKDQLSLVYACGNTKDPGRDFSKVYRVRPFCSERDCVMDLSRPSNVTSYREPVGISTIDLSNDETRDILMVGGFKGEYAFRRLSAEDDCMIAKYVPCVTDAENAIINHINTSPSRSGAMIATLACNDFRTRHIDLASNKFLYGNTDNPHDKTGHKYPWPINCTALSPDRRLRVLVGDTPDVAIVDATSGRCERLMPAAHYDHAFACAWSPDGQFVATAAQDRVVRIFDTRVWRAMSTFEVPGSACVRSLKFSPVGGGAKTLMCGTSAHRMFMVDAKFIGMAGAEGQEIDLFGEIAGCDWDVDGKGFWVANSDRKFGGMMHWERGGYGQEYGMNFTRRQEIEENMVEYREEGPDGWVSEEGEW